MMSVLDAALAYAAYGFSVFPCLPRAKEPAVKRGFYAATTNPETIRRLFRSGDCNVAIRTGMASHVWAIDSDGEVGEASLCALEAKHGTLPATWQSLTARGRHIWFCCDDPVPSSAARIAPGIDARGDGGYILVPPRFIPPAPAIPGQHMRASWRWRQRGCWTSRARNRQRSRNGRLPSCPRAGSTATAATGWPHSTPRLPPLPAQFRAGAITRSIAPLSICFNSLPGPNSIATRWSNDS